MKRKPINPSEQFPEGTRITVPVGCVGGDDHRMPWEEGYSPVTGRSLGFEYGQWLAVQWDNEDDPNWNKLSCTILLVEKRPRRKVVK